MLKKILFASFIFIILGAIGGYFLYFYNPPKKTIDRATALKLFEAINLYADALLKTDEVYTARPSQISLESWKKECDNVLAIWQEVDQKTIALEKELGRTFPGFSFNLNLISKAHAYSAEEISAITDKVPPNQRIKTLVKLLNVDAKRAFQILQTSQNQMEANAWNEEGDTMEEMENTAKTIKNGCKISLLVGGVLISGGATTLGEVGLETFTAGVVKMGLFEKGALLASNVDLVLEMGDDAANIGLGYNNDVSAIISKARKFTAPLAAISGLLTAPTESGYDAFNFVMMGADQLNSMLQNNEVLGFSIPEREGGKPQLVGLKTSEVNQWLKEEGIPLDPIPPAEIVKTNINNIGLAADFVMPKVENKTETKKEETKKAGKTIKEEIVFTNTSMPSEKQKGSKISLIGNNFFKITIFSDNSIKGTFHIGEDGIKTLQSQDTAETYTSFDYYFSGELVGKFDPVSGAGSGEATTIIYGLDASNGQSSSSPFCPNTDIKAKDASVCTFTFTKQNGRSELKVIYGLNSYGFTVSN